eukprot:gene37932-42961_t
MSFAYGTYSHQYAWTLSTAYLSGTVPFTLEFTFLILLVAVGYASFRVLASSVPCSTETVTATAGPAAVQAPSVARRCVAYMSYILLTFTVVVGVNVAYVVIALNENGNALTAAQ